MISMRSKLWTSNSLLMMMMQFESRRIVNQQRCYRLALKSNLVLNVQSKKRRTVDYFDKSLIV